MDGAELMVKTKKALRALLISAPRGVPKRLLLTDYRMVMGKELPFRNLGFSNLEDFIRSVPDVMRVAPGTGGEPTLFPVVTAETEQIARFVATQKKPKLKKSLAPPAIVAPPKLSGFSAKSSYGRGHSRSRSKFRSGTGSYSSYSSRQRYFCHDTTRLQSPSSMPSFPVKPSSFPVKPSASPRRGRIGSTPTFYSVQQNVSMGMRSVSVEPPKMSPVSSMWREEYASAHVLSISELWKNKSNLSLKLVRVTGYICTFCREDRMAKGIKYLLYSDVGAVVRSKADGRGMHPAAMLYFNASRWNRQDHPGLFSIPPGTILTVYGNPFVQISLKNKGKEEPAIRVYYYEKGRGSSHVPPSANVSTAVKPQPAPPTISPMSLKDSIYHLLRKNANGVYLAKLESLYLKEFGKEAPQNLVSVAKSLPGVICTDEIPNHPLIYLDSPHPPSPPVTSQRSGDSPQSVIPALGYVSTTLKNYIFGLLREYPSGVPVTQLDELYVEKFYKEPPSRLVELAKSLPEVICKEVLGSTMICLKSSTTTCNSSVSSGGSSHSSRSQSPSGVVTHSSGSRPSSGGLVSSSLKQNIFKLLEGKENGVYLKQLPKLYKLKYKYDPPQNIAELVCNLDFVRCEEEIPDHPVLFLKDLPPEERPSSFTQPKPSTHETVSSLPLTLPGTVKFTSEEEVFDVTVTYISSVTSFYVQIYGKNHSAEYLRMMADLEQNFQKSAHRGSKVSPEVEQMYGYLYEDEGGERVWCRAILRSIHDQKAHVMFPDYGNSDLIKVTDLKDLPPRFYKTPFQAVQCCLHGVTEEEELNARFIELALNNRCTAQVMDSSGSRVSVELMDSDPSHHETINSILLKMLHPISLEPKLPEPGEPMVPVFLVDVDLDKGFIVLQIQGPGYNQLQHLMTLINDTYLDKEVGPDGFVCELREGLMCCALYKEEGKWYRVQVTKVINANRVTVLFVDYGNEDEVCISDLRAPIDDELFSLPFQGVKCTMAGLPPEGGQWTDTAVSLLWEKTDLNVLVVENGSFTSLPSMKLLQCLEGEEQDLNQWLLEQSEVFFEATYSDESPITENKTDVCTVATPTPTLSSDDLRTLSPAAISELKNEGPVGKVSATTTESVSDKESVFSEAEWLSSDSQSVQPIFSTQSPSGELSPVTPPSTSSQSTQAPYTPSSTPSPLLLTPSPSTLVTPLQNMSLSQLSGASLPLQVLTQVMIPWIESPSNFVVQLSENLESLEAMVTQLNEMLDSPAPSLSPSSVSPGLVCCAASSIDDQWHRVVVLEPGADSAHVFVEFLDYGGREEVKVSTLRALSSQFTGLPVQGIKCCLYAVKPSGDKWSEESIEYFTGFAEKQYFAYCKKVVNNIYSVVIFDGDDRVNEELQKKGFATAEQ